MTELSRNGALRGVPIEVRVCVGRARPRLSEMLDMAPGAVLPLDSAVEDRVTLYVGDRVIAEGDLVELDQNGRTRLAVRITHLPEETSREG